MRPLVRRTRGSAGTRLATVLVAVALVLLPGLGDRRVAAEDGDAAPIWSSNTAGLEAHGLSSLRIHTKAPEIMWAHVHGLGICRSAEGGTHWEVKQQGIDARHLPGPLDHCEISLDPRDEKIMWLVTKGQVYRSEDQGESWQHMSTGALASWSWDRSRSTMLIRGVVVDPKKSLRVLAGTRTEGSYRGGLYESTDGGKTWEQIAGDDVDKSELSHDAWPIVLDPRTDKNVAVGGSFGFWYSTDRGRKFKRADPGEIGFHDVRALTELSSRSKNLYLADGRGVWSSRDGGKRWDKEPILVGDCVTVATDSHNRRLLYAVLRDRGVLVSEDAKHDNWEELGHADLDVHEVLRHPRDKTRLYFVSPTTGLHLSKDGGVTVGPVRHNADPYIPLIAAVAAHPREAARAMALTDHGVVFLSSDGGRTWTSGGRTGMRPTLLMGDPEASSAWWAAGRELVRSLDNGGSWEVLFKPEDPEDRILDLQRLADGSLWMLLERSAGHRPQRRRQDVARDQAPAEVARRLGDLLLRGSDPARPPAPGDPQPGPALEAQGRPGRPVGVLGRRQDLAAPPGGSVRRRQAQAQLEPGDAGRDRSLDGSPVLRGGGPRASSPGRRSTRPRRSPTSRAPGWTSARPSRPRG